MAVLKQTPTMEELELLIGANAFAVWKDICVEIDALYDMDCQWNDGGKQWKYEYKYRRGGKTLCALYAQQNCFGFMIIFGKEERAKVEEIRAILSSQTLATYDAATTYRDGKWVMFDETILISDMKTLLAVKRKSNKK